jgi:hypothetical protein
MWPVRLDRHAIITQPETGRAKRPEPAAAIDQADVAIAEAHT